MANGKCLGLIGDINYLIYDGMLIFTKDSRPYAEMIVTVNDMQEDYNIIIYRFDLDRISHPENEWFADEIKTINSQLAMFDISKLLKSNKIMDRALAYYEIGNYLGFINLDHSPKTFTYKEAKKRYSTIRKKLR